MKKHLKKWILMLVVFLLAELIFYAGFRLYAPTRFMDDKEALNYILSLSEDDRRDYVTKMSDAEGRRLVTLYVTYKCALAEKTDIFSEMGQNYDTSGKTYEDYMEEADNTYQLSDGSGYVTIIDGVYHVYDNDGNELDPTVIADDNGVISMDLF